MGSFRTEVSIAAPREWVWLAWTQSERITQWFAPDAHIEPRLGGAFELYFTPSDKEHMSTRGCMITLWEPGERLGFTWKGPDPFDPIMNHEDSLTYVLVTLSKGEGGTDITVEHFGWKDGADWEEARSWHVQAWSQVLSSLKSALEAGEGKLCCV